jgi:predicted ATPase
VITRIEAYRYRCFSKLAVELGAYNVLAGANGSGKTALLDIPVLLGDLLAARVCSAAFLESQPGRGVPRANTLTELIHQGRGDDFVLVVEARLPHDVVRVLVETAAESVKADPTLWLNRLRYEVRFQVFNQVELHVLNEYLFLFPEGEHAPDLGGGLQGEPEVTVGRRKPKKQLRRPEWQSVMHRDRGDPVQFFEETNPRARPLTFRVPPLQLALASLPFDRTVFPAAVWFQDLLREEVVFYEPDLRELRRASPPGQPQRVLPSGRNLAWLALDLQRRRAERFDDWVDHVRATFPQVEALRAVEREDDHHAYLVVDYQGGYQVTSSGLSDGTLRILALTILLYLAKPPAVLVHEEPENGVHPRAIEAILQVLTSLYDSQVWISTHSPVVLAQTDVANVLCACIGDDGAVEMVAGPQHPRLKDWQGELDLGSLFAAGVLG